MAQDLNVPRTRLILEAVAALIVVYIMIIVVVTGAYFAVEGYNQESITGLVERSPDALAFVQELKFLTKPVAMLLAVFTVFFMLKLRDKGFQDIGLKKPDNIAKTILYGIGIAAAVYVVGFGVQWVMAKGGHVSDTSSFNIVQGNLGFYLFAMTIISWVSAAFCEEVIFRGFILNNLAQVFENTNTGFILAIVIQAIVFGLLHESQGLAGMVIIGAMALVFGFAYFKFRNLWPLIIGHALVNNYSFTMLYLQNSG